MLRRFSGRNELLTLANGMCRQAPTSALDALAWYRFQLEVGCQFAYATRCQLPRARAAVRRRPALPARSPGPRCQRTSASFSLENLAAGLGDQILRTFAGRFRPAESKRQSRYGWRLATRVLSKLDSWSIVHASVNELKGVSERQVGPGRQLFD
jgi:hypothetical protein